MEKNKKSKWLKIGILIVILIAFAACVFGGMTFFSKIDKPKESTVIGTSAKWLKTRYDNATPLKEDQTLARTLIDTYHLNRHDLSPGWSVYGETLDGKKFVSVNENSPTRSASIIKPFIVCAAYQYCLYPQNGERALSLSEAEKNEIRSLSNKAVSESDNDSANRLILLIGEGDKNKGFDRINTWCREQGFSQTKVGRLFLESNPTGDNFTSAADCVNLLTDVYHKKMVNDQTSSELIEFLKGQTDRGKIPRYIDGQGATIANKTGELNADYGLGFVDSDVALVYNERNGFALAVLMGDENNHFEETNETISLIAKTVFDAWMSK